VNQENNFNNLIALFLAEEVRSRRTSLQRAAEISQRVVSRLKDINTEGNALAVLTEIEKDFREVTSLRQALHFGYKASDVKIWESEVKDYASKLFSKDMRASAEFLRQAAESGATIQDLCIKYPAFSNYIFSCSEKAPMIEGLEHAPC
jgi:hypothetical protein